MPTPSSAAGCEAGALTDRWKRAQRTRPCNVPTHHPEDIAASVVVLDPNGQDVPAGDVEVQEATATRTFEPRTPAPTRRHTHTSRS